MTLNTPLTTKTFKALAYDGPIFFQDLTYYDLS